MIIRIALWLFLLCLPIFLLAKALLIFAFVLIASLVMKGAIFLMFAAFGLLIFSGLFFILKHIWQTLKTYFSTQERENRRILFTENQTSHRQRLFHFQRLQLHYFKEQQRKKILEKNNLKHIQQLSDAIEQELNRSKSQLSKTDFSKFQRENRLFRLQKNELALLELHQKIATIVGK
jgi:biopolymer transport protein ExbB/TolQ